MIPSPVEADGVGASRGSGAPALSIVVPCYNEEAGLDRIHASLTGVLAASGLDYEIVLVDNGSTDGSPAKLAALVARDPRARTVRVPVNRGYGLGIRTGLAAARGAVIGWVDADDQVDPASILDAYHGIQRGEGDFAVAQRVERADGWRRRVASRGFNAAARWLLGTTLADVNGKPKLARRDDVAAAGLVSDDWFVDTELVVKLERAGLVPYAPVAKSRPRATGRSNVRAGTVLEFARNIWAMRRGRLGSPRGAKAAAKEGSA